MWMNLQDLSKTSNIHGTTCKVTMKGLWLGWTGCISLVISKVNNQATFLHMQWKEMVFDLITIQFLCIGIGININMAYLLENEHTKFWKGESKKVMLYGMTNQKGLPFLQRWSRSLSFTKKICKCKATSFCREEAKLCHKLE
jgi:hypothetical protein